MQEAVRDTAVAGAPAAGQGEGGGGNLYAELLHHVYDSRELDLPFLGKVELPQFAPVHIGSLSIDFSITKHVVFLWAAAILLIVIGAAAARKNRKNSIPRGLGNLMEIFVLFIRDEIA